jgi:type II secretory pathway component PulK
MNLIGRIVSASVRTRSLLSSEDGIALLMVLVVVTILTTLVVSFTDTTQKHLQVTQHYKDRLMAYWAGQSGLQAAVALLKMDAQLQRNHDGATSPWHYESEEYQQFVPLLLANVFCESSMIEPALLLSGSTPTEVESFLGAVPAAVPILDENRKLSIYGLVENLGSGSERTDTKTFMRLAYLLQNQLKEEDLVSTEGDGSSGLSFGFGEETEITIEKAKELAGYLVDWMDTENSTTTDIIQNPDTAEESCPVDDLPYEAKGGMLDSIDEIGLVCGFRQMPRTTIERLTRHLTAYDLETNINTATHPVLHAFCAAFTEQTNDTNAEEIYEALHYSGDEAPTIIQATGDYADELQNLDGSLITLLRSDTAFASTVFRVGIYGVRYNTETGTVLARSRVQMDLLRNAAALTLLYYRED